MNPAKKPAIRVPADKVVHQQKAVFRLLDLQYFLQRGLLRHGLPGRQGLQLRGILFLLEHTCGC
jgi:hypothetical protein